MARRAAWGYLALVLLFAPMLGLMHGLVHGVGVDPHAAPLHAAQAGGDAHEQGGEHDHDHDGHWLSGLFSTHGEEADCRVFDQLSHSDILPMQPVLFLPMVPPAFLFLFLEGEVLARWAALFQARGPPLTR